MNNIYRFSIGSFKCTVINDGTFTYPMPGYIFFFNAPQEELALKLQQYGIDLATWEQFVSDYLCLVIETPDNIVLVDTGMGTATPTTGNLISNLAVAGYLPEDIDTVILSHGHPDHIGGNLDVSGQIAFPNARWVMWHSDWAFWTQSPDLLRLPLDDEFKGMLLMAAQSFLPPLAEHIELIEDEVEIVPGIQAIAAPGHTPGHMALLIESNDDVLLHIVDAGSHPLHLEYPEWLAAVDLLAEETTATRRKLCALAVEKNATVFAYHFPFPGLGSIEMEGDTYRWRPLPVPVT